MARFKIEILHINQGSMDVNMVDVELSEALALLGTYPPPHQEKIDNVLNFWGGKFIRCSRKTQNIELECSKGHTFVLTYTELVEKCYWCPKCLQKGSKEEHTRNLFELRFGAPFIKARPAFLKNPNTERNLELDGYCEELNLAFEYNGEQHYKISVFSPSQEDLDAIIKRDTLKAQLCLKEGVHLIIVPAVVKGLDQHIHRLLCGNGC